MLPDYGCCLRKWCNLMRRESDHVIQMMNIPSFNQTTTTRFLALSSRNIHKISVSPFISALLLPWPWHINTKCSHLGPIPSFQSNILYTSATLFQTESPLGPMQYGGWAAENVLCYVLAFLSAPHFDDLRHHFLVIATCWLLRHCKIIGAWNHSWTLHDDGYPYFVESTLLSIQFVPTANTRAIDYWCSCWALLALGTFYYCWYGTARGPYVEDWNWCQVRLISFWCCIWFDLGLVFGLPKLKQYSGVLDELKPGRIQSYAHFYSAWHIFSVFIFDGPLHPDMKQGKKVSTKAWWLEHYFKDMIVAFGFSHYDVHVALFTNWWITHRIYRHLARQRQNLLRWITLGLLIQ